MSANDNFPAAHEIDGSTYIKYHGSESHVTIPEGITAIGDSAFAGCGFLRSVTIPEGVTELGPSAFEGCRRLERVHIPDTVTVIRFAAFEGCASLTSITIPEGVTAIEKWTFKDCASLTSMVLPQTVTELCNSAFRDCYELRDIQIPEGVTAIGESSFRSCTALTSISLPDSIKSIGKLAFRDCVHLESISLHESTAIGEEAFMGCPNLSIHKRSAAPKKAPAPAPKLPKRKAVLDDWLIIDGVLSSYSGTASHVEIPSTVTEISSFAFGKRSDILGITVPHTVTEIGEGCFKGCENLAEATVVEGSYAHTYFAQLGIPCRFVDAEPTEAPASPSEDSIEELWLDVAETERLRHEAEEAERRQREAEEAERLRIEKEAAEMLRRTEEAKAQKKVKEAEKPPETELMRQKRRETAALRKRYDALYDDIARQDYIIMTNSGMFGQAARNRKEAEKRRASLQAQMNREFPKGRPK